MRWQLFLKPGTGLAAERQALRYLKRQGLTFKAKNYACYFGEIDLVMQDKDHLVFIEVRFRKSASYGLAGETVSTGKQRKIIAVARHFLQSHRRFCMMSCRFDIVALSENEGKKWCVQWIKNAFMA